MAVQKPQVAAATMTFTTRVGLIPVEINDRHKPRRRLVKFVHLLANERSTGFLVGARQLVAVAHLILCPNLLPVDHAEIAGRVLSRVLGCGRGTAKKRERITADVRTEENELIGLRQGAGGRILAGDG